MRDGADDEPRDDHGRWSSGSGTRSSKEVLAEISSISEKADKDYDTAYNAAYAKAHEIMKTEGAGAAEAHLSQASEQAKNERDNFLNPKIEALTAELYKSKAAEKEEEKQSIRRSEVKAAQKKADDILRKHEFAKTSAFAQTRKTAKGLLEEHKAALAMVAKLSARDSAMPRLTLRDSFVLDGVHRSESGYLAAHAKVARTGVQVYQGCEVGQPDKPKVTLYRPAEEVFHVDAMHSMAHRPVTLTHPPVMVDSKNWKKYAKGQTTDPIVRDGEYVSVPITLMDQATIDAYESGDACELSMGYTTDIDWTAGVTPQGEAYDGVQRNIRANHLAFVPQARGGENLRFGDEAIEDGGPGSGPHAGGITARQYAKNETKAGRFPDIGILHESGNHHLTTSEGHLLSDPPFHSREAAEQHRSKAREYGNKFIGKDGKPLDAADHDEQSSQTKDGDVLNPTSRKYIMPITAAFDGVTVEFADELSASNMNTAFSALKAKLKDAEKKSEKDDEDMDEKDKKNKADCDDAKAKIDAKDGEIAVLKKQLADAAVTPAMLDSLLRDREVVKEAAKKVLDAKFVFDGKSIADIKHAAVVAKLGDAAVKDMNEAAVSGAFVALTAAAATTGTSRLADALGSHTRNTVVVGDRHAEGVRLRDEAHALMVDRLRNPKSYDADGRKVA